MEENVLVRTGIRMQMEGTTTRKLLVLIHLTNISCFTTGSTSHI